MSTFNFKHGLLVGCIFGGSLTYIITRLYIDKYYMLIPNKMSYFLDTYKWEEIIKKINGK